MAFVLDTSVTMAWCFEDEATDSTDAVLDRLHEEEGVVPSVWPLEVSNVLIVAERRRQISEAQAGRFLGLLAELPIVIESWPSDLSALLAAGRRHELSAYDASYLLLAERLGAPIATVDQRLSSACLSAGITLLVE